MSSTLPKSLHGLYRSRHSCQDTPQCKLTRSVRLMVMSAIVLFDTQQSHGRQYASA